jgi:hypothetical protein
MEKRKNKTKQKKGNMMGARNSVLGHWELIDVVQPINDVEQPKGKRKEEPGPPVNLRHGVRVKELEREPFVEGAPRARGATVIRL